MTPRTVYFAGSEMLGIHGLGLARAAQACLGQQVRTAEVTIPYLTGEVSLPYLRFPGSEGPLRPILRAVGESALANAGIGGPRRRRTALFVGSSSLDVNLHEQEYLDAFGGGLEAFPLRNPDQGYVANCLAADLGLEGPRHTFLTACSSGANALLYAGWMIRSGQVDDALVIGTEAFNRTSLLGFHGMLLVSRGGRCRPFDVDRDGIVLGEAVAATVVSAAASGARWRLCGGATLCDTGQPTTSSPEKIAQTIGLGLADAGFPSGAIAAIKAHGTGTGANDLSEAQGILAAFPEGVPPFTSLKPVLSHTLGACGVAESLATMACLDDGWLPGVANLGRPDPELGISPQASNAPYSGGPVLLNYFGFGGNNCVLVVAPAGTGGLGNA